MVLQLFQPLGGFLYEVDDSGWQQVAPSSVIVPVSGVLDSSFALQAGSVTALSHLRQGPTGGSVSLLPLIC
jgi:hypothetical protein